ncbi:acyltransferase family protein [Hyphomicrobium sp. MC8b]|uniref:acyltransferase family protein n=1 Tax=Hyphomicrobium sp. MC8b TaxID=300273 RepID=UPI00391CBE52
MIRIPANATETNNGRETNVVKRIDTIDSLRGLAILLVICFHYLVRWAPPFFPDNLYQYSQAYSPLWELGRFGVEFFFVISGTVIALTVESSSNAVDFLFRRFSRIYPALICSIFVTFFIVNVFGPEPFHRGVVDIISSMLMLPAVLPSKWNFQYVDGVYWSLAVEFKFYAVVAFFLILLGRRFWAGIILFGILGEICFHIAPNLADKIFIHQYMSFFLFGVAIAQWHFSRNVLAASLCLMSAVILYVLNLDYVSLLDQPSVVAALFVATGVVLMGVLICLNVPLSWRPLLLVGQASYSLYLLHENIGITIISNLKRLGFGDMTAIAIAFTSMLALAVAMFNLLEKPAQRALRQMWKAFPVFGAARSSSAA